MRLHARRRELPGRPGGVAAAHVAPGARARAAVALPERGEERARRRRGPAHRTSRGAEGARGRRAALRGGEGRRVGFSLCVGGVEGRSGVVRFVGGEARR